MPDLFRCRPGIRAACCSLLLVAAVVLPAADASAKVTIGYCQGQGIETFTVSFLVCCPGDLAPTEISCTTAPVNCSDPGAVMAAVAACMASFMHAGMPVFGPGAPVGSPVGGQMRMEWPLDPAFAAAGCCVIGGNVSFKCGTMSLAINCPCDKPGGPPDGPGPFKLGVLGPPPGPVTLVVWFIGCPPIPVPLDGTETPAIVAAKILAALIAAGYSAFINPAGQVEVIADCTGAAPLGVEEFGPAGGAPMALELEVCPPDEPLRTRRSTWGGIKALYAK
jgi:hypothetical protein